MRLTTYEQALGLAADSPGNPDYDALLTAATDVEIAREKILRATFEMRELQEILEQKCTAVSSAIEEFTRAQVAQRIVEIRTGINQ